MESNSELNAMARGERKLAWRDADIELSWWRYGPGMLNLPAVGARSLFCAVLSQGNNFRFSERKLFDGRINKGSALLLPQGLAFGVRIGLALELLHVQISERYWANIAGLLPMQECAPCFDPMIEHYLNLLVAELNFAKAPSPLFWQAYTQMLALHVPRMLSRLHTTDAPIALLKSNSTKVDWQRLRQLIREKIKYELAVEDLAAKMELSQYQLLRLMKRELQMTPQQLITEIRIDEAKHLMDSTPLGLAEIALEVGFSSQSHLSNVFKQITGVTPNAYRKGGPLALT